MMKYVERNIVILIALLLSLHSCSAGSPTKFPEVGYPTLSDTIPSRIIERICYTVSYNNSTFMPNWVMWQLKGEQVMKRKEGVWNEYHERLLSCRRRAELHATRRGASYSTQTRRRMRSRTCCASRRRTGKSRSPTMRSTASCQSL